MIACRSACLLLLAPACWLNDAEIEDKLDTVDEDGEIDVTSIVPDYGPSGGGTRVTLRAEPIAEDVEVFIGGIAAQIEEIDPGQVVFTSPPGEVGPAEVEVRSGEATGRVEEAWRYWEDGTDRVGAAGSIQHYHYVGDYWDGDPEDFGFAWAGFIQPAEFAYWMVYASGLDTCESGYAWAWYGIEFYPTGADQIELRVEGGSPLVLPEDPGNPDTFALEEVPSSTWVAGGSYALEQMEGDGDWPPIEVEGFVETPSPFSVFGPALEGTYPPDIERGLDLEWSDAGAGDYMLAALYRKEGGETVEILYCAMEDDGGFSIPWWAWDDWTPDDQVTVLLGRVKETGALLPHDGSRSGMAGVYWVIGAGITVD